jgi:predicted DNA-binding transcriptional regulator YafY
MGTMVTSRSLVADRFRRIWHLVEDIAQTPGQHRCELANKFHLSERQIQADLQKIRFELRLPLVRRQGYRFADEGDGIGGSAGCFDLREAQLLVLILRQAAKDRSIPTARLGSLMAKLPAMFPPHLRPLVGRTLEAVQPPRHGRVGTEGQVFAALADALLRGVPVKLHYPVGDSSSVVPEPIITPELLLPYLDSWFVVGEVRQRRRSMMLSIDSVDAVTLAADDPQGWSRTGRELAEAAG